MTVVPSDFRRTSRRRFLQVGAAAFSSALMPAYAKDGKVICFFQAKSKFKVRYSTLGFQPDARLDEDQMWPVAFALKSLTAAGEKRIAELVNKAAG